MGSNVIRIRIPDKVMEDLFNLTPRTKILIVKAGTDKRDRS